MKYPKVFACRTRLHDAEVFGLTDDDVVNVGGLALVAHRGLHLDELRIGNLLGFDELLHLFGAMADDLGKPERTFPRRRRRGRTCRTSVDDSDCRRHHDDSSEILAHNVLLGVKEWQFRLNCLFSVCYLTLYINVLFYTGLGAIVLMLIFDVPTVGIFHLTVGTLTIQMH